VGDRSGFGKERNSQVRARVYVTPKVGVLDPAGKAIERGLHSLGFTEVLGVRLGKYIEIELADGADAEDRLGQMCRQLLANGVIEDYRFELGD
jgi:phosphoribosylformylglycinamidine synthase subunit PurS